MSKTYINGELVNSSTNYAAAIEYTKKDGSKTTVQDGIDNLRDDLNNKTPFSFGVDANGNYGYIKDGADTVTPFFLGQAQYLATFSNVTTSGNMAKNSYTFTDDYKIVFVYMIMCDSDNNGDNFMKCYSTEQTETSYTNLLNITTNEWDYIKPIIVSDTGRPEINNKYTNDKDKNKDIFFLTYSSTYNSYCFTCIAYKCNVKKGESVYTYAVPYWRNLQMIIGIK